jgi:hypothetical protein
LRKWNGVFNAKQFELKLIVCRMNRIAKLVGLPDARASGEAFHAHFSLKAVARVTSLVSRCISIAPAMLDC